MQRGEGDHPSEVVSPAEDRAERNSQDIQQAVLLGVSTRGSGKAAKCVVTLVEMPVMGGLLLPAIAGSQYRRGSRPPRDIPGRAIANLDAIALL